MNRKNLLLFFLPFFLFSLSTPLLAAGLKIGFVNLNQALNQSDAGKRSTKLLETRFRQTQAELQLKEQDIIKKESALEENIMLSQEARAQQTKEIAAMKESLRGEMGKAQQEIRKEERRYTESLFKELKLVVKKVARDQGYDMIVERAMKELIIFYSAEIPDVTDLVIQEYNKLQTVN